VHDGSTDTDEHGDGGLGPGGGGAGPGSGGVHSFILPDEPDCFSCKKRYKVIMNWILAHTGSSLVCAAANE
jgi:hypothetical protein